MTMRLMQRLATPIGLLALTVSGCSKKEAGPAPTPAPVSASETPEAKPEAKPEEARPAEVKPAEAKPEAPKPVVAPDGAPMGGAPKDEVGKPLTATPAPQKVGDKTLTATWCRFPGDGFIGKSASQVIKAIEVVGDRLYLLDGDGLMYAYVIDTSNGCTLAVDTAFGDAGKLKTPKKIDHFSKNDAGTLFAGGIFETLAFKDGKQVPFDCKATGHIEVDPGGKWAFVPWVNSTVETAELSDTGCTASDWVLKNLNDDAKRVGPYKTVMASAVIGDKVYLGAIPAEKLDGRETRVIAISDKAGKESLRFGATAPGNSEDRFGWVHGISACGDNVCVVDSNYRRLTVWTRDGKYLGFAPFKALFGMPADVIWTNDISTAKDGSVYIPAGQARDGVKVGEGLIFRITGF